MLIYVGCVKYSKRSEMFVLLDEIWHTSSITLCFGDKSNMIFHNNIFGTYINLLLFQSSSISKMSGQIFVARLLLPGNLLKIYFFKLTFLWVYFIYPAIVIVSTIHIYSQGHYYFNPFCHLSKAFVNGFRIA